MTDRKLNPLQVGALLISASYGIGFLFGPGELALQHGMAGSIYGLATAGGMLLLALFARPLWKVGAPIWDVIGQCYGEGLKRATALLSLVWMAGVLAAQLQGGIAVLQLAGLPAPLAWGLVLAMVYAASRANLGFAASAFGLCLLASGLVMVYALVSFGGVQVYLTALPRFTADLSSFDPAQLISTVLAIVILVCTGADYQQFVLAARTSRAAGAGCVVAAVGLLFLAFLPAALVMSMGSAALASGASGTQVIPRALELAASRLAPGAGVVMLGCLSAAALGCGAAILRAMTSAIGAMLERDTREVSVQPRLLALVLGAVLAARGQGIIETMVSVNVIYIASIAVVIVSLLLGRRLAPEQARQAMMAGFLSSSAVYGATWAGVLATAGNLWSLVLGLGASAAVCAWHGLRRSGQAVVRDSDINPSLTRVQGR